MSRTRKAPEEGAPFWKQRGWQASAAFLVLVALSAALAFLTSDGERHSPVHAAPLGSASGADSEHRCPEQDRPTAADAVPTDLRWETLHGIRVPVSAAQGPVSKETTLWRCFAHSRTGAALAAQIICSQMSGPHWRDATRDQVVPGRGRDRFATQREFVTDASARTSAGAASWAGYRTLTYREDAVVVELLIRTGQGYAVTSVALRWSDRDWKVQAESDGALHSPVATTAAATGYTLWEV